MSWKQRDPPVSLSLVSAPLASYAAPVHRLVPADRRMQGLVAGTRFSRLQRLLHLLCFFATEEERWSLGSDPIHTVVGT